MKNVTEIIRNSPETLSTLNLIILRNFSTGSNSLLILTVLQKLINWINAISIKLTLIVFRQIVMQSKRNNITNSMPLI